jgi:hypothetical protein
MWNGCKSYTSHALWRFVFHCLYGLWYLVFNQFEIYNYIYIWNTSLMFKKDDGRLNTYTRYSISFFPIQIFISQSNHYRKSWFIWKLNQELVILTFDQFDHLVILKKPIRTCLTWVVIFLTNHKMIFLTNQIRQKFGQLKKLIKNSSICKYKNVNNKYIISTYLPTHPPWLPTYLSTTHLSTIHLHTCIIYIYTYST